MLKAYYAFLILAVLATIVTAERKSHFLIGGPFFSEFLEEDDYVGVGSCTGRPVMKWNRRGKAKEKETEKEITKDVSAKKVKKIDDKKKMEEKEKNRGWFSSLKFDEMADSME